MKLAPRNLLNEAWNEFVVFLKEKGSRITRARRITLEHALSRADHFRADDLSAVLATGRDRVSRGTVYRTLALMVEAGFLRQIRDSDTHAHYECVWNNPHHEHMICDTCGAFIEFTDEKVGKLLDEACEAHGFTQKGHRVVIFGLCKECRERLASRKK